MMEDREYGDMDVPNYMRGASKGFTTHFYINGDEHYQSKSLLVNPKRYRNFDTFLDDATRSLNPRFGAIRNVYTPLGKHKISSFDDLKEDGQYVAAGVERYKNIGKPYTAIEGHSPRPSKINKTNFNNRIEPVFHSKIRQDARFRQSQSFASKAKRITVAINNDEIDHPHVILIPAKKANDLPSIIETVAKDLEERGVHHRVEYLVDTDSELVCTNADDIIEDHIYVACNKASRYKHKTYTRDGRKNFVVIPSPRPLQRPKFIWESSNVNGSRENKRPRTLPPIGSKNYKGSPDNSVASNPEYRRKPNQANGAIHTKPQKHKRTPEKKPKQTDYDRDDGGVFKAKDTNKHTKGAKEDEKIKSQRTPKAPQNSMKDKNAKSSTKPEKKETTQKTNSKTNSNNNNKSNTNQKTADHSHGSKDPAPKKHSGTRGEFNNVSPLPDIGQQNRSSTPIGQDGKMSPTQKEKDQAAAKIQANYRGHKTRQELAKQKEDVNKKDALNKPADTKKDDKKPDQKTKADTKNTEMKEDEAATKIQAGFRGHKTRQELKKQQGNQQVKDAKNSSVNTGKTTSKRGQKQSEEDKAATKIQAGFRGHKTRKELAEKKAEEEELNHAATKIQANYRGHKTREELKKNQAPATKTNQYNEEEEKAATKIQAGFRGHQTRKQLNQQDDKANAQQDQKQPNAPPAQNNPPAPTQSDQTAPKGDNANKKPESAKKGDKPPNTADSSKAPANQETDSSAQKGDKPPNTADSNKPTTQKTEDSAQKGDKPPNTADSNKPPAAAGQIDQSASQEGNTGPTAGGDKTN
ncbi:doublecortin domain-containing protein 2-like isoform X5 [Saccostrea echinata]|uniref:doublecortin domain-containing protein 2-like isoform X5 n=1 Tax=Saccostrea echinata TaxID=191078 RepID=UPI002A805EB9|nr:doublecortin domain-containing protein 2-like isoform X5 [Saccostrea echinata]